MIDLPHYEQFKFELAEVIRSTKLCSDEESGRRYQELLVRLAVDQFNVVVVGRFNRGKTSLMNAVLGSDWLPTGIVPLTSVITTVRYGTRERVLIEYETSGLRSDVPLTELRKYVTEEGNPGNRMRVKEAEVQLPAELLRRGFCFVDTPGLGSAIAANELTTERYIPEIDALILVTSFEGPLSDDEIRFLQMTRDRIKKVFVIINKSDLASPDEREQVRQFVETRLRQELKGTLPRIFCVSAREGLEAKRAQHQDRLHASGVLDFENALTEFLTTEKMTELLLLVCDRLLNILQIQPQTEQLKALGARAAEIQKQIPGGQVRAEERSARESMFAAVVTTPDLHEVPGCEVCRDILDAVLKFMSQYQYYLSTSGATQTEHADRGGFCTQHTWQYEKLASPQGVCTAYPALLARVAAGLERAADSAAGAADIQQAIEALSGGFSRCLACAVAARAEHVAVTSILSAVTSASDLHGVSALCLPHLKLVIASADPSVGRAMVRRAAVLLRRTSEDMQRYSLKHDALRRDLASDEEQRAYRRALLLLCGHMSCVIRGQPNDR